MSGNDELFQFPSEFPIKVMGRDSESFRTLTLAIVERHAGPMAPERISERKSSKGSSSRSPTRSAPKAARSSTGSTRT